MNKQQEDMQQEMLKRKQAVLKALDIKMKNSAYNASKKDIERKKEALKKEIQKEIIVLQKE